MRLIGLATLVLLARYLSLVGALTFAEVSAVYAQPPPDLAFPKEVKELSFFSQLTMGIWKPKGDGPFPAVILVHTCGGLDLGQQLVIWRKEAIQRGYVAFIIDSFLARGSRRCLPGPAVDPVTGMRDVVQAADHLATFSFVDASRIAAIGMSWGGIVTLLAASPWHIAISAATTKQSRLAAAVSLYPECKAGRRTLPAFDTAIPILVLMGAQDTETPPEECLPNLQWLKDRGRPVEWHVFPDTTHCWDCPDQNNRRWNPPWAQGRTVIYVYGPKVTKESAERVFDFLSRHLSRSNQ